jgi:hypothetical protein
MTNDSDRKAKENVEKLKLLDKLVKESMTLTNDFFDQEITV